MKVHRVRSLFIRAGVATSVATLVLAPVAPTVAAPTDPTIVHGNATFRQAGKELQITNSPGTIIDWRSFSIGQDEITRFQQQFAESAVLNRVTGAEASRLAGQLLSNGRVFLVNPNGVVFGQDVTVDTAGFVASTLEMTNEDFLAGDLSFAGDGGRIVNEGFLATRGGNVYLIAADIENSGVIHAEDGSLVLAAGHSVRLTSLDSPDVRFEVTAPEHELINLGSIIAERGAVQAFAGTLRHAGEIHADTVRRAEDGSIVLSASGDLAIEGGSTTTADGAAGGGVTVESTAGGTVTVAGEVRAEGTDGVGGRVRALGERVAVTEGGRISADGTTGGGEVLLGGNLKGAGPEPNAARTVVAAGAEVTASATKDGDGGTVIAFGEELLRAGGSLAARGGPDGGDGGFVETSSHGELDITVTPDVRAPTGAGGEWLIDPDGIRVVNSAPGNPNITEAPGTFELSNETGNLEELDVGLIDSALTGGATVTVDATGDTMGVTQLVWDADLILDATNGVGNSLRLDAIGAIMFNGTLDAPNSTLTALSFNSGNGFDSNGSVRLAGTVSVPDASVSVGGLGTDFPPGLTFDPGPGNTASLTADSLSVNGIDVVSGSGVLGIAQPVGLRGISICCGFDGPVTLVNNSAVTVENLSLDGTLTGSGMTVLDGIESGGSAASEGGQAALDGHLLVVEQFSVFDVFFGPLEFRNGAELINRGRLMLASDFLDGGGAPLGLTNEGLVQQGEFAAVTLEVPIDNRGDLVLNDAMTLAGGGTLGGTVTLSAPLEPANVGHLVIDGAAPLSVNDTTAFVIDQQAFSTCISTAADCTTVTGALRLENLEPRSIPELIAQPGSTIDGPGVLVIGVNDRLDGTFLAGGLRVSGGNTGFVGGTIATGTVTLEPSSSLSLTGDLRTDELTITDASITDNGDGGTLTVDGVATVDSIDGQSSLALAGDSLFGAGSTLTGSGVVFGGTGTTTLAGNVTPDLLNIFDGTVAVTSTTTTPGDVFLSGGILRVDGNFTIGGSFSQFGGEVDGSGTLALAGTGLVGGGFHGGTGTTRIEPGAQVATVGLLQLGFDRLLDNSGTLLLAPGDSMVVDGGGGTSAGMPEIGLFDAAMLRNTGTLEIAGDFSIVDLEGAGSMLVNEAGGTILKSAGGDLATTTLGAETFINEGAVIAEVGTITSSTLTWRGGSFSGAGLIDLTGATFGPGALAATDTNLRLDALDLGNATSLSVDGGTLEVSGDTRLAAGSTLALDTVSTTFSGALALTGSPKDQALLSLAGTDLALGVGGSLEGATVTIDSESRLGLDGGTFGFGDDVTLTGGPVGAGLLDPGFEASLSFNGTGSGTRFDLPLTIRDRSFAGDGRLNIADVLELRGDNDFGGTLAVETGGSLQLVGDTAAARFAVADLDLVGGRLALGVDGTVEVPAGTNLAVTTGALTVDGGTIEATGAVDHVVDVATDLSITGGRLDSNATSLAVRTGGAIALSGSEVRSAGSVLGLGASSLSFSTVNVEIDGGTLGFMVPSMTIDSTSLALLSAGSTVDFGTGDLALGAGTAATLTDGATFVAGPMTIGGTGARGLDGGNVELGSLTMTGGTLTRTGALTVTDGVEVNGGTLSATDTLTAASLSVGSGGTTELAGGLSATTTTVNGGMLELGAASTLDSLNILSGTLKADADSSVTTQLSQSGGLLTGAGTITTSGAVDFSGGTQGGSGTTAIASGTTATLSGEVTLTEARIFSVPGTLDITGDFSLLQGAETRVESSGTITKSAGAGTATIGGSSSFSGTINVDSGILDITGSSALAGATLGGPGTVQFSGPVNATGLTLSGSGLTTFDGGLDLDAMTVSEREVRIGAAATLGSLDIASSELTMTADLAVTGTTTISGGALSLDGGNVELGSLTMTGGTLTRTGALTVTDGVEVNGGTLSATDTLTAASLSVGSGGTTELAGGLSATTTTVDGGILGLGTAFTGSRLTLNSGTIELLADTPIAGSLELVGGTLGGSGTATLNGDSPLIVPAGAAPTISGVELVHTATSGDSRIDDAQFLLTNGGSFRNEGTLTINASSGSIASIEGAGNTLNTGTLITSAAGTDSTDGAGSVRLTAPFENAGTVRMDGGLLLLGGAGTHAGTFMAGVNEGLPAADLRVAADQTFTPNSSVSVPTFGIQGGTTTFAGDLSTTTLFVQPAGAPTTFVLESPATVGVFSLEQPEPDGDAARFEGAGDLRVTDLFSWAGGTIAGSGAFDVTSGASANLGTAGASSAPTLRLEGRTLRLASTAGMFDSGTLELTSGARFINSGALNVSAEGDTALTGSAESTFMNTGSLVSEADLSIGVATETSGTLSAPNLTLAASTPMTISGGTTSIADTFSAAGDLTLAGGGLEVGLLTLSGSLDGSGTITGTVQNAGVLTPGASPGIIAIDGDYEQTTDGILRLEVSGDASTAGEDFDLLEISGTATFAGRLELATLANFEGELGLAFQPLSYGNVVGDFEEVIQPSETTTFEPTFGETALTTQLTRFDGQVLEDAIDPLDPPQPTTEEEAEVIADEVACAQETTQEDIETTEDVVQLDDQRQRAEDEVDDQLDRPAADTDDSPTQGVGCRST